MKYFWDLHIHGITPSAMAMFLRCRRQFWLRYVQGWESTLVKYHFEFGNMVHYVLDHIYGSGMNPTTKLINKLVEHYLAETMPWNHRQKDEVILWGRIACAVLPSYFSFWEKKDRLLNWKFTEKEFRVPFRLSNDCSIDIRGKIDGVVRSGKSIAIFDTKCKSKVVDTDILDLLRVDLQMMVYSWAIQHKSLLGKPPNSIIYNTIKRPGHKRGKKESETGFVRRIASEVAKKPSQFFQRFRYDLAEDDLVNFERNQLTSIIRQLQEYSIDCTIESKGAFPINSEALSWGFVKSEYYYAITRGDFTGLRKRSKPFSELEG